MQLCIYAAMIHHPSSCAAELYCKPVCMQKQQFATAIRHSPATNCSAAVIYALQIGHCLHRTTPLLQATAWQQATLLCRSRPYKVWHIASSWLWPLLCHSPGCHCNELSEAPVMIAIQSRAFFLSHSVLYLKMLHQCTLALVLHNILCTCTAATTSCADTVMPAPTLQKQTLTQQQYMYS